MKYLGEQVTMEEFLNYEKKTEKKEKQKEKQEKNN